MEMEGVNNIWKALSFSFLWWDPLFEEGNVEHISSILRTCLLFGLSGRLVPLLDFIYSIFCKVEVGALDNLWLNCACNLTLPFLCWLAAQAWRQKNLTAMEPSSMGQEVSNCVANYWWCGYSGKKRVLEIERSRLVSVWRGKRDKTMIHDVGSETKYNGKKIWFWLRFVIKPHQIVLFINQSSKNHIHL